MAAAALSHEQLIAAFEARFDFLTARTMLNEVLDSAQVGKAGSYDAAALAKIGIAVEKLNRPQPILERMHGASAAPVAAAKPAEVAAAPKVEAKVEEAKPAADAAPPAAAKEEAAPPAEAAPAESAKPEAKHEGDKPHDGDKKGKK